MTVTCSTGDAGALARYLSAATLTRGADVGAPVGLALLATSSGLRHGAAVGGLLAAALTAPHLLGPWVARRLDVARDGRKVLAAAFLIYALALASAGLLLGHVPVVVVLAAAAVAGTCGPLLTGGLSSRLTATAGEGREGWDALSYGLGGTGGPALVAVVAATTSPLTAVLALAVTAGVGAALTLTLPRVASPGTSPAAHAALGLLARNGPLRRVTVLTLLAAFGTGGLAIIAAVLGSATLVAAFGVGNLAGSLLVTAFPLRGEPERAAGWAALGVAVALGLGAVAPGLATFALAGLFTAPFFTATLAARAKHAPEECRAQVFVAMAGLKVAAASAGAALTGATIAAAGPRGLLAAGALITLAAVITAAVDDALTTRRRISEPGTAVA